jgi:hypothetical protein
MNTRVNVAAANACGALNAITNPASVKYRLSDRTAEANFFIVNGCKISG